MTGVMGAEALGLYDRGVIEVGYRADLVLLSANPEQDIANTRKIQWVMKERVIVSGIAKFE